MPKYNPMVTKWIPQLDSWDQASSFFAYMSLEREVLRASRPGNEEEQAALAKELADALVAVNPKTEGGKKPAQPACSAGSRRMLARLLGYLPSESAVAQLTSALDDLEAREMARWALETNDSEAATDALIGALEKAGAEFRVGVVNSLAKRGGSKVQGALRKAASDPQLEVRVAALHGLATCAEPGGEEIIAKAAGSENAEERRAAHIARVRLAATLRARGRGQASDHVAEAVLSSDAPEPQKKAAQRVLDGQA